MSSASRVASNVPLTSSSNVFTLSYTNSYGATSTTTFTINVNSTPLTPYIQVNGGTWQQLSAVTVNPGDKVSLGPQNLSGGSFSWSGNGFTAATRAVSNVPLNSASNVFTLTYTNTYGATSTLTFTITVGPTALTPYIQVNNGAWQVTASAMVHPGDTVSLGPQNLSGGSFSWTGPNGFIAGTRAIAGVPLTSGTNAFTLTYTNTFGATSKQTFTITLN